MYDNEHVFAFAHLSATFVASSAPIVDVAFLLCLFAFLVHLFGQSRHIDARHRLPDTADQQATTSNNKHN